MRNDQDTVPPFTACTLPFESTTYTVPSEPTAGEVKYEAEGDVNVHDEVPVAALRAYKVPSPEPMTTALPNRAGEADTAPDVLKLHTLLTVTPFQSTAYTEESADPKYTMPALLRVGDEMMAPAVVYDHTSSPVDAAKQYMRRSSLPTYTAEPSILTAGEERMELVVDAVHFSTPPAPNAYSEESTFPTNTVPSGPTQGDESHAREPMNDHNAYPLVPFTA